MAVYTELQRKDIDKILNNYGITCKIYHRIKNGILNTNYYIESDNKKFVLRVFEGKRKFCEEEQELNFLLELHNIIPCCIPVKTLNHKVYIEYSGKMVALFYFIEGEPIIKIEDNFLKEIGKYLAQLHNFTLNKKLDRKSRVDLDFYYSNLNFLSINKNLIPQIKQTYFEVTQTNFESLPKGIIHNDIFPDNIFQKFGKIVGILDFNEAKTGVFIEDLAIVINFWIRIKNFSEEIERRKITLFLKEYQKYRILSENEIKLLPVALKKMALTFILLRMYKTNSNSGKNIFMEDKNYQELLPLLSKPFINAIS